jgi:hypothetical protein
LILLALGCQVDAVKRVAAKGNQPDSINEDAAFDGSGGIGDALDPAPLLTPDEDGSEPTGGAALVRQPVQQPERPAEPPAPDEDGSEPPGTTLASAARPPGRQDDVHSLASANDLMAQVAADLAPMAPSVSADSTAASGAGIPASAMPADASLPSVPVVPQALGAAVTLPMKGVPTPSLRGAAAIDGVTVGAQAGFAPLAAAAVPGNFAPAPEKGDDRSKPADTDAQADVALMFLHKRMSAEKKEEVRLRKRLAGTIRWGLKLKKALLDEERAENKEKRRVKALFSKHEKQTVAALDKAHKREVVLSVNLQNATRTAATRATTVGNLKVKIAEYERDHKLLHSKLAEVASETLQLRAHLSQEMTTEADLRQKLSQSNIELSSHLKIEAQERKAEAADRLKIASKVAALEKTQKELQRTRTAKSHEDATLNVTRRELKATWTLSKQQKESELTKQKRMHELLSKEKAAEERAKLLGQALEVQKKQVSGERAHEQQMGQLVNALRDNVRREVSNLTWRLGTAENQEKDLKKMNNRLQQLLRGNISRISNLQSEVVLLKKRVDDGDAARRKAEKAEEKAEDEKIAAEAVSKQLSGTVPRLLEQAQMAHEAHDTEKAMRAQAQVAQAQARNEMVNLEQQYTSAVQGQLEQLNQVLPKLGASPQAAAAATVPDDLALDQVENDTALVSEASLPPAPVTEDLADAVGRAAAATSVVEQPVARGQQQHKALPAASRRLRSNQPAPDLARDSQGLGMLLSQDDDTDYSKISIVAATMVADSSDES